LFLRSIEDSDFVYSPRGDANGSQRFYEVLSSGRIPVVPNSKIILPNIIEGGTKPYFLEIRTLSSNLARSIETFWSGLDKETYFEIQMQNRKSFKYHLSFSYYIMCLFGAENLESWQPFIHEPESPGDMF
jgi:hypothetical protein